MKSTQTILDERPWRVGVSVVAEDTGQPEYVDGIAIPKTKVSEGYFLAHGKTIAEARERVSRLVRTLYKETILNIGFFNTVPYQAQQGYFAPLPGLTLK